MIRTLLLICLSLPFLSVWGQELNCQFKVNVPKLQTADPNLFVNLESAIFEFMNNRKWTSDKFKQEERIECSFLLNITEELAADRFKGQLTIQSNRPVYNSSMNTVLFNHIDVDVVFEYSEFQPLEFNENQHLSNLTSLLAYYAYIIIGFDYDSFGQLGGTPYFDKAQAIVNNAQNTREKNVEGWKAFDGSKSNRNRYWLVKNLLEPRFKNVRVAFYKHHRLGLDKLYDDINGGRKIVLNNLKDLLQVHNNSPSSMIMQVHFNAKSTEYINIFSEAPTNEKAQAVQMLSILDATNASSYNKIMK